MGTKCQGIAKVFFERSRANSLEHWKLRKKVVKCLSVRFDGVFLFRENVKLTVFQVSGVPWFVR